MRKFKNLILLAVAIIGFSSCEKVCDCKDSWDADTVYVKDDLVSHDGKCWVALAQGEGIIPGPWLVNGNDIWEECTED